MTYYFYSLLSIFAAAKILTPIGTTPSKPSDLSKHIAPLAKEASIDDYIHHELSQQVGYAVSHKTALVEYRYSNAPYKWGVYESEGGALHRKTISYDLMLGRLNEHSVTPVIQQNIDDGCYFQRDASTKGGPIEGVVDLGEGDVETYLRFICEVRLLKAGPTRAYINMWLELDTAAGFSHQAINNLPVQLRLADSVFKRDNEAKEFESTGDTRDFIEVSNGIHIKGLSSLNGTYRVRVRLSSHKLNSSAGKAFDGEVEDYLIPADEVISLYKGILAPASPNDEYSTPEVRMGTDRPQTPKAIEEMVVQAKEVKEGGAKTGKARKLRYDYPGVPQNSTGPDVGELGPEDDYAYMAEEHFEDRHPGGSKFTPSEGFPDARIKPIEVYKTAEEKAARKFKGPHTYPASIRDPESRNKMFWSMLTDWNRGGRYWAWSNLHPEKTTSTTTTTRG